jgi:ribosomal protein S27AE
LAAKKGEDVMEEKLKCPKCGSINIEDWKTFYECNDCGYAWSELYKWNTRHTQREERMKYHIYHKSKGLVASFLDKEFRDMCYDLVCGFNSAFYIEDDDEETK